MSANDLLSSDGVERATPGGAPTAFRIWRAGKNQTDRGPVFVTPASIAAVLQDQARRGNLYSIDCDHKSLSETAPPEARVALGWNRLASRDGEGGPELWACDLEWGPFAKAQLEQDPPGFRYFSPAYDFNAETRELTRYLNMALTINPATWNVTALASAKETRMTLADLMTALKAMLESGTDEEKKAAAAMLEALKPAEEKPAPSEGDAAAKAAEGGGEELLAPKKEEAKLATVSTTATVPSIAELASQVRAISNAQAAAAAAAVTTERASLAARPGLSPELANIIKKASTPIATARELASVAKPPAGKPISTEQVGGTRGEGQGERATMQLPAEQAAALNAAMGIRSAAQTTSHVDDQGRYVMPIETPSQTRARLAAQKGKAAQ